MPAGEGADPVSVEPVAVVYTMAVVLLCLPHVHPHYKSPPRSITYNAFLSMSLVCVNDEATIHLNSKSNNTFKLKRNKNEIENFKFKLVAHRSFFHNDSLWHFLITTYQARMFSFSN